MVGVANFLTTRVGLLEGFPWQPQISSSIVSKAKLLIPGSCLIALSLALTGSPAVIFATIVLNSTVYFDFS